MFTLSIFNITIKLWNITSENVFNKITEHWQIAFYINIFYSMFKL